MTGIVSVPWYFYAGFLAFVVTMLLVDLRFFRVDEDGSTARRSAMWMGAWVGLAIVFGAILFVWRGPASAAEYFAGYVIEYSLSVDNMFIFLVIFSTFGIPVGKQHRVLFLGILGALFFRSVVIGIGAILVHTFRWVIYLFGGLLLYTAYKIFRKGAKQINPEDNPVLRLARRYLPTTTRFDGRKLFTEEHGRHVATPLFVALLVIEVTDIVFALDSIPAVFGVTRRPFIVLTSNVFAVLGLRSLYFLLSGALRRLHLLHYGLAVVLAFVGAKMLLEIVHVDVPIWLSLAVIVGVLGVTTLLSLAMQPPEEQPGEERGRPGEQAAGESQGESQGEGQHETGPSTGVA